MQTYKVIILDVHTVNASCGIFIPFVDFAIASRKMFDFFTVYLVNKIKTINKIMDV